MWCQARERTNHDGDLVNLIKLSSLESKGVHPPLGKDIIALMGPEPLWEAGVKGWDLSSTTSKPVAEAELEDWQGVKLNDFPQYPFASTTNKEVLEGPQGWILMSRGKEGARLNVRKF